MSQYQISLRYANSIYSLAQDGGKVDEVHACMQSLGEIIANTEEFRDFLNNPLLSETERARVIKSVFSGKVPELVERFLFYINCKNRLKLLPQIVNAFDDRYLSAHNRVRAQIQVALPIETTVREQILAQLGKKYGKDVLASWVIRKEILGGFRILIEGRLHDYSFTNQLEKYRAQVLQ